MSEHRAGAPLCGIRGTPNKGFVFSLVRQVTLTLTRLGNDLEPTLLGVSYEKWGPGKGKLRQCTGEQSP